MMFGFSEYSEEGRPWFHVGRVPVTTTTLLVAIFSISMVVVSVVGAADRALSWPMISAAVWSGAVWQVLTWPLYNPPDFCFVLSMVMMFLFGREVERVLGRTGLLKFVGWLALVLTVVTLVLPGGVLAGSSLLGFGIFLAYAIMHPNAPFFFGLTMKWVALIFIGLFALQNLYYQNWPGLVQLAALCVASAVVLKSMGAAYGLPWLRIPQVTFKRRTAAPRVMGGTGGRDSTRLRGAGPREFVSPEPEIDRLLDKVAAEGLHSLTDAERRLLADASERYQRRK